MQSPELVRAMFSLLHRQYDGLGELLRALPLLRHDYHLIIAGEGNQRPELERLAAEA